MGVSACETIDEARKRAEKTGATRGEKWRVTACQYRPDMFVLGRAKPDGCEHYRTLTLPCLSAWLDGFEAAGG